MYVSKHTGTLIATKNIIAAILISLRFIQNYFLIF